MLNGDLQKVLETLRNLSALLVQKQECFGQFTHAYLRAGVREPL